MKSTVRKIIPVNYNPLSPTPPAGLGLQVDDAQFEQALVIDVITNDEHELYKGGEGFNVGMVKFQLRSDDLMPESTFAWAYPMFSNISQYPLRGEIVYIFRSMKRWWYLTTFNISNRPTTQDLPELLNENSPQKTHKDISEKYASNQPPTRVGNVDSNDNTVGHYFKDLPDVYRLKHREGDMIIEGRSGSSIRLGSSWLNGPAPFVSQYGDQAPNLIIRVGPDPKAKKSVDTIFGLVSEDINKDESSVWITSDQVVDLQFATSDSEIHGKSVADFPKVLDGNQMVLNTGRFVINAKTNKILGNSYGGIHWTTLLNFSVDAQQDYVSYIGRDSGITIGHDRMTRVVNDDSLIVENNQSTHANKNIYLTAGETTYIGAQTNIGIFAGNTVAIKGSKTVIGDSKYDPSLTEPLVCGTSLAAFLAALIDALAGNPVPSPAAAPGINTMMHIMKTGAPGSPSALNPLIAMALMKLKTDLLNGGMASFNSRLGFVRKTP